MSRVVVVGAGVVGASCALYAARAGWEVTVLDAGPVAGGTTSHGEGNLLVSDKGAGPELDLMLSSRRRWLELGDELGRDALELEEKGGLVVAASAAAAEVWRRFAAGQRLAGVEAQEVDPRAVEPYLADGLAVGVLYPQDLQVQPVLATQAILEAAMRHGAVLRTGARVVGASPARGTPWRLRLADGGTVEADAVVNAAGTWGGEVARALGAPVPVLPRRGFVLVTEPLHRIVNRKVYSADYVDNVGSSDAGLQTSCVIEGTRGGTVLIGASRERVGFDGAMDPGIVRRLAAQAVSLFPVLADVRIIRTYRGFRPYCPDHLPVIGPDPRHPGLVHACGHEGAGIGLAPATGAMVTALLSADRAEPVEHVDGVATAPFAPVRFVEEVSA